jgi:hypothetical protein
MPVTTSELSVPTQYGDWKNTCKLRVSVLPPEMSKVVRDMFSSTATLVMVAISARANSTCIHGSSRHTCCSSTLSPSICSSTTACLITPNASRRVAHADDHAGGVRGADLLVHVVLELQHQEEAVQDSLHLLRDVDGRWERIKRHEGFLQLL